VFGHLLKLLERIACPGPSKDNISFSTKWLSNRRFLNEVQVGTGKKTPAFQYRLGNYGNYAGQIISIGNCITLRSSHFRITEEDFFNTDNFENFARYSSNGNLQNWQRMGKGCGNCFFQGTVKLDLLFEFPQ
jgi:hypothetical protein